MSANHHKVPDFVREKLKTYNKSQLSAIVRYVQDDSQNIPDEMPDEMVSVFALQDETTQRTIGKMAANIVVARHNGGTAKDVLGQRSPNQQQDENKSTERNQNDRSGERDITQPEQTENGTNTTSESATDESQMTGQQVGYEGLAQAIIDHVAKDIGAEKAVSMAQSVERLYINEQGYVTEIDGSGQIVVEQLADKYIAYIGITARNELASIADEFDVEPPVNLDMTFN